MTTRTTSRDAFHELVRTGQLIGKQALIMNLLTAHGDATSGEVLKTLRVRNVNAWRARFTELQARGLIVEVGQRKCAVSGRRCVVWHATDRTKPMDVKRGARGKSDARTWEKMASDLAGELSARIRGTPMDGNSPALARYRELAVGHHRRIARAGV